MRRYVRPTNCPWGQKAFDHYLGADRLSWKRYDATELVKDGKKTDQLILIDQGGADEFLEAQLKPQLFQQACEEAGQRVRVCMRQGYDHSYYFIASFIGEHLGFHNENLNVHPTT